MMQVHYTCSTSKRTKWQ